MVHKVSSKADLNAKLAEAGDKLVVIDFYATWCGPCKLIAPFLEEQAEKYKERVVVLKVDVDEVEELVGEYGVQVMPTFIFMSKGKHLDTLSGSNKDKLLDLIEKNLKTAA